MNENEVRQWLRDIVGVIRQGATLTDTEIDEQVCDAVLRALDSDLLWGWIWKMIGGVFAGDDRVLVADEAPLAACEDVGIDPLTIIAIVRALIEIWRLFR